MTTIKEWFIEEYEKLKSKHVEEHDSLLKRLYEKQKTCEHSFVRHEHAFYAFGDTWPGMVCEKCSFTRHLTEKEKS